MARSPLSLLTLLYALDLDTTSLEAVASTKLDRDVGGRLNAGRRPSGTTTVLGETDIRELGTLGRQCEHQDLNAGRGSFSWARSA